MGKQWWSQEVRQRARERWATAGGSGTSLGSCTLDSIAETDDDEEENDGATRRRELDWERLPSYEFKSSMLQEQ